MPRAIPRVVFVLLAALLLSGSINQTAVATYLLQIDTPTKPGIDVAGMDRSVEPGEDFYSYANGGWMEETELDPAYPSFGASDEAGDNSYGIIADFLLGLDPGTETAAEKSRLLFDMLVDEDERNDQGIEPIQDLLDEILAINSIEDGLVLQQSADTVQLLGLFAPFASSDPQDATQTVAWLYGPELSLPSDSYYLDEGDSAQAIRDAWVDATADLLRELGYSRRDARAAAEAVMAFEIEVARIKTPDSVAQSDPTSRSSLRTLDDLSDALPAFDWQAFVEETSLPDDVTEFYVTDVEYLDGLGELLDEADPLLLQYLFASQLAWAAADYLTTDMRDIAFSFNGPVMQGVTEQSDVINDAFNITLGAFPDVFSEAYVDEALTPEAKAEIEAMVEHIVAVFRVRIQENEWMSDETKAKAIEKLDLMTIMVGYPDTWDDYADVEIGDSPWETMQNIYTVTNEAGLGAIGTPVDRTAWSSPAYEVNAYYSPTTNSISLLAGILQPPYYDPNADLAFNYGGIGAIIGHEITHAFDVSGSQYDGYGNLVEWWTQEDFDAFSELNAQVIDQYSEIEVLPDLYVDGELTITENVADMGGIQVAYDALELALEEAGTPMTESDQQRFFVAYAQSWRDKSTPEFTRLLITTDEHAPGAVRAVQPLRNMDQFFEAFGITSSDEEYLPASDRVVIW